VLNVKTLVFYVIVTTSIIHPDLFKPTCWTDGFPPFRTAMPSFNVAATIGPISPGSKYHIQLNSTDNNKSHSQMVQGMKGDMFLRPEVFNLFDAKEPINMTRGTLFIMFYGSEGKYIYVVTINAIFNINQS